MYLLILSTSIVFQFIAVILALKFVALTKERIGWLLITIALFFMSIRRIVTLFGVLSGEIHSPTDLTAEYVALSISLLMLSGVYFIGEIFTSMVDKKEKLQSWSNSPFIGIIESNKNGNIFTVNDAFINMLGYTRDEYNQSGLDWKNLTPKEFLYLDDKALEECEKNGCCLPYEKEYLHKKGHRIPILISFSILPFPPHNYTVFIIDLSQQKHSEQRLDIALQATRSGVWDLNIKTGKIKLDQSWLNLFGYNKSDELNHVDSWRKLIHPDDLEKLTHNFTKHLDGKTEHYQTEYRIRHKSGHFSWTLAQGKIVEFKSDGSPLRMVGTDSDISNDIDNRSKLKNLNSTLLFISHIESQFIAGKKTKLLFEQILSHLLSCTESEYGFIGEVHFKNDDTPYLKTWAITDISWDKNSQEFYAKNAPQGLEFYNLKTLFGEVMTTGRYIIANNPSVHPKSGGLPDGHPSLNAFLGIPIYSGETITGMIGIANKANGYDKNLISLLQPLLNSIGTIISGLIDRRKKIKAENTVRRTLKMDAIGQLSAGVSHDFNNILAIIIGNTELIELDKTLEKPTKNKLVVIKKAAERASQLTQKLQRLTRIELFHIETFAIDLFIKDIIDLMAKALTPQVKIKLNFAEDAWLIDSNKGDLQDVILNLTINARDAMRGKGELTFTLADKSIDACDYEHITNIDSGEYILLTISDTGIGIQEEVLPQIFDPFFTTKDKDKGTGLGLAMVYNFMRESGGFIDVSSELGIGTSFLLYFKKSPAKIPTDIPITNLPSLPTGSNTLLIVDDESELLTLAKNTLNSLGYKVLTASNVKQAMSLLRNEPTIDLLFSDIVMPGEQSGFDLASFVNTEYPHLKVLLTSGYNSENSHQGISSNLLRTLLYKPYRQSEMVQRITALLKGQVQTINNDINVQEDTENQNIGGSIIPDLWQEQLSLGIPSMDDDHKVLLTLIHQAKQTIDNSAPMETKIILDRLMDFTRTHLKREEEVMLACEYPNLKQHQAVHHLLLKQVNKMEKRQQLDELDMTELFDFLSSWWLDHIQTMDKAYADFCRDNASLIEEAIQRVDAMSADEKEYK